jgi:hypothetical protein
VRRWVLVIGIFAAFIIATALVAYNARKNSPVRKVQEEIARLKREGEPTSWQEIAPPIPKHLDGTPLLLKAVEQLHAAQQKFLPNVWETYNAQVLEAARPALKTFRQALAFPHTGGWLTQNKWRNLRRLTRNTKPFESLPAF